MDRNDYITINDLRTIINSIMQENINTSFNIKIFDYETNIKKIMLIIRKELTKLFCDLNIKDDNSFKKIKNNYEKAYIYFDKSIDINYKIGSITLFTNKGNCFEIYRTYKLKNPNPNWISIGASEYGKLLFYELCLDSQNFSDRNEFYNKGFTSSQDRKYLSTYNYTSYYSDITKRWKLLFNLNVSLGNNNLFNIIEDKMIDDARYTSIRQQLDEYKKIFEYIQNRFMEKVKDYLLNSLDSYPFYKTNNLNIITELLNENNFDKFLYDLIKYARDLVELYNRKNNNLEIYSFKFYKFHPQEEKYFDAIKKAVNIMYCLDNKILNEHQNWKPFKIEYIKIYQFIDIAKTYIEDENDNQQFSDYLKNNFNNFFSNNHKISVIMLILKEVFTYDIDKKAIKKLNLSTEQADEFCGGLYKVYNKDYLNFSDDEKYTIYLIEIFNKMKEIIQINENTNILHTKTKLILNILNKINPEKLTINYQSNDLFCLISKIKQNINSYNSINNILKSYFDNPQIFGIAHTLNNLTKVNYKKNFEIDTNIMPYLSLDHFDTLFYYRNKTISSDKLMDTLNGRSCLVFGEGGIGKTVTLRYIMENYINQNNDFETFFFIELANFSNYLKEKDVNDNGLMVYIFDYYLKNEDITYDLFEKLWKDEFSMHFTLLLDGFNEIAESKRNIAEKCISYVKRFENVQIIISDRYYDGIHIDELSHIELKALTIPQVYQYLKTKKINVSNERIELFKILTIPLFLTIYIELKTKNKKENLSQISTKGELLDIFFYPKYSKKNEFYNQYKRYKSIKFYEDISLLFKYVVPYIAYQMVFILDKIEISHLQLKSIINNYFELYNKQEIYINDIDDVHLMDEFYNSYFNKEAQLIYTLRNNLRILIGRKDQENIMVYKFFHQHIRDFFASQYIINDLKYNNNGKNLLINNQLNSIILTYIGEILHEYNTNSYTIGTFLKHKVLDKCTFYTKENDYILSNLLEIWKNAKNNNIIGQFYDLDFSNCQLSGINFHTDNDNSDFYSCTFKEDSFLSDFDGTVLNGAVYHPKINDRIVIASCNGTVQEWNIKTEKIEYIYFGTDNEVENALYRNDGKKILACFGRDVLEFDVGLPKNGYRKFGGNNGIITRAIYNYNNTVILTSSLDGIIREYDYNTGSLLCEYHNNDVEIANNAIYNKTEEYILASYGNGDVVEFLKNNNPEIHIVDEPYYIYKYHKNNGVAYCTYSPDESRIASGGTDYLVKEYTVHRMENDNMNIIEYVGHKDVITGLCYHKKSQQLFSCSADGTIRGWKLTDFNQKKIIVKDAIIYDHHTKAIEDIDIDITKNTVISSSWDRTVKEYTIDNKDNFHEIKVIDELYHSL